jgi:hypothetical protein
MSKNRNVKAYTFFNSFSSKYKGSSTDKINLHVVIEPFLAKSQIQIKTNTNKKKQRCFVFCFLKDE